MQCAAKPLPHVQTADFCGGAGVDEGHLEAAQGVGNLLGDEYDSPGGSGRAHDRHSPAELDADEDDLVHMPLAAARKAAAPKHRRTTR